MPKVLIVTKGHHNYDQAKEFGDLMFISETPMNIFASSNLKFIIDEVIKNKYNIDDYLLLSGHLLPNSIAFHAILKKHGKVQTLAWIGNLNKYKVITVDDEAGK